MYLDTTKRLVLVVFCLMLSGCAGNKPQVVTQKPIIKTIAVLPVKNPDWFYLENRNLVTVLSPITGIGFKLDSREKAKLFTDTMLKQSSPLGKNLALVLVGELNKKGYEAKLLEDVKGPPDDPEYIDYTKLNNYADAVLYVYFHNVGVFAGNFSTNYLPDLSITGSLVSTKDGSSIYDETLYYGIGARENVSWGIMANPKFAYPSFDALIENSVEVGEGFDFGSQALGRRMIENIKKAL